MGTKLQYKMHLPGYYRAGDLNDSTANGSWASHNEYKTFEPYYDLFSTRPGIHGHMSYVKKQMKEAILKHETIFKHQVHELHRLYKMQMDIMNEVRSKDLCKHLEHVEISRSGSFSFAREDEKKRWHSNFPSVDFTCHLPSGSGADNIQSPTISVDVNIRKSDKEPMVQDHEPFESRAKKLQRRLFGVELLAEKYINDEKCGQGKSGWPGKRICDVAWNITGSLSTCGGVNCCCTGDALSSNMILERKKRLSDLNEPVLVEETDGTASVSINIPSNITCSKEQIHGQGPSTNSFSGFQCLARAISQAPFREKGEGVGLSSPCLENKSRENGLLPYACSSVSGQPVCDRSSLNGDLLRECLPALCESAEVGCRKAQEVVQNKPDEDTKKTIFGVEILARNHVESATGSDGCFLQPLSCQSSAAYPESSSFSSWKKQPKTLRQNLTSLQGNLGLSNLNKSSAIFINGPDVTSDSSFTNSNAGSVPSIKAEFSYQSVFSVASQLESKESKVNLSSSVFGYPNGISNSVSASEKVPLRSPTNGFMMNAKSIEELNVNALPPKQYQNHATFDSRLTSVDCPRKEIRPHGVLSAASFCNGKSNGPHRMDLECLENYSQWFVNKGAPLKDLPGNVVQDSLSMTNAHDPGDRRIEGGYCSNKSKILGVPVLAKHILEDIPSASFLSDPSLCDSKTNVAKSRKSGLLDTDLNYDPMLSDSGIDSGITQNTDNHITEVGTVDCSDNARNQIDLNVSATEEEAELTQSLLETKLKIAVEIDLEVPVVVETEIDCTSGCELPESKVKEPLDSLKDESRDFEESSIKGAAEALVAISSSSMHDFVDNSINLQLGCSVTDSLQWFAEIITSHKFEIENLMGSVKVVDKDGTGHDNSIPNGMDYFEYMTLNLSETKVEECNYEPQVLESTKHETALLKRPRRGQARRGRQQKDFQRDVLPGLASLSRNHVTEDLQKIEGLIRATGGAWQSAMQQRNSPKNKGGRGRKRSGSSATTPKVTAVSPPQPQAQQVKCSELGLEEGSRLAGWGKRTRRPPRQRCPINQHIVAVQ